MALDLRLVLRTRSALDSRDRPLDEAPRRRGGGDKDGEYNDDDSDAVDVRDEDREYDNFSDNSNVLLQTVIGGRNLQVEVLHEHSRHPSSVTMDEKHQHRRTTTQSWRLGRHLKLTTQGCLASNPSSSVQVLLNAMSDPVVLGNSLTVVSN